jgi:orotate phosphoribosyltransferase
LTRDEILDALEEAGAVRRGHFKLTSGLHSDTYIQTALVLEHPYMTKAMASAGAERFQRDDVDVVISPAVGAIVFGYAVADQLGARFIYAERERGKMRLRRNFAVEPGEKAVVVEDVVTTGSSVAEVVELVKKAGGEVLGVISLVDRGGEKAFCAPVYNPVLTFELVAYDPADCPMCAKGLPIDTPGSRQLAAEEAAERD